MPMVPVEVEYVFEDETGPVTMVDLFAGRHQLVVYHAMWLYDEGRLCPKGATALQLAVSSRRATSPLYRAPGAAEWQRVSWDFALDKLARNVKASRDRTFVTTDADGNTVNRCEGVAFAGGAAFSSEEGYLAAKLMRGLGVVYLEQQARV